MKVFLPTLSNVVVPLNTTPLIVMTLMTGVMVIIVPEHILSIVTTRLSPILKFALPEAGVVETITGATSGGGAAPVVNGTSTGTIMLLARP